MFIELLRKVIDWTTQSKHCSMTHLRSCEYFHCSLTDSFDYSSSAISAMCVLSFDGRKASSVLHFQYKKCCLPIGKLNRPVLVPISVNTDLYVCIFLLTCKSGYQTKRVQNIGNDELKPKFDDIQCASQMENPKSCHFQ